MSLIKDEQVDILNILPLFPSSWQHIPLFRGADNHITLQTNVSDSGPIIP